MTVNQNEITLLHPQGFSSTEEAEEMVAEITATLEQLQLGTAEARESTARHFEAVVRNAAEHGRGGDRAGRAYALLKFNTKEEIYRFTVSDTGPGIRATLARAGTRTPNDQEAVRLALEPGTEKENAGLALLHRSGLKPGHALVVSSGTGAFTSNRDGEATYGTGSTYPGTFVAMVIPAGETENNGQRPEAQPGALQDA